MEVDDIGLKAGSAGPKRKARALWPVPEPISRRLAPAGRCGARRYASCSRGAQSVVKHGTERANHGDGPSAVCGQFREQGRSTASLQEPVDDAKTSGQIAPIDVDWMNDDAWQGIRPERGVTVAEPFADPAERRDDAPVPRPGDQRNRRHADEPDRVERDQILESAARELGCGRVTGLPGGRDEAGDRGRQKTGAGARPPSRRVRVMGAVKPLSSLDRPEKNESKPNLS